MQWEDCSGRIAKVLQRDCSGVPGRLRACCARGQSVRAACPACRAPQECVARKKGDFASRIAMHRWADVVRHNDKGGCYVVMDGMVLDLEAWLPQHPGGATIIPQQALNRDCTVYFELYHASRESFTYLREFYIGELAPGDLALVPHGNERASEHFMAQLREFATAFRVRQASFEEEAGRAKAHLGA